MTWYELGVIRLRVHMEKKRHQRYSHYFTSGSDKVHHCEDERLDLAKRVDREGVIWMDVGSRGRRYIMWAWNCYLTVISILPKAQYGTTCSLPRVGHVGAVGPQTPHVCPSPKGDDLTAFRRLKRPAAGSSTGLFCGGQEYLLSYLSLPPNDPSSGRYRVYLHPI